MISESFEKRNQIKNNQELVRHRWTKTIKWITKTPLCSHSYL